MGIVQVLKVATPVVAIVAVLALLTGRLQFSSQAEISPPLVETSEPVNTSDYTAM